MARQTDDSNPNLKGEKGVQVDPSKGIRSPVKKGTPRGTLKKIPEVLLNDLRRRIAEVKFSEVIRTAVDADKPMDLDAAIKEASKKKYGGLIDSTRINEIHANPNKFINQLGIDPADLKTGEKLPTVSDLRRYVRNSLDNVEAQVGRLNKHLFPEGVPLDHIVRSIHFGHGQALGSAGPHVGDEGLAQLPMENIGQGKLSGPSKGELDLGTGRYKVNDAYSAIGHPQFWDEVLSNFIMGRKHVPVLVELTPEGKNRVIHQGHDPDSVIIEEGEIKLRNAVTGETKVKIDPASEADPLHDYGRTHQPGVDESSKRNLTRPRDQQILKVKPQEGNLSEGDLQTLRSIESDPEDRKGGSGIRYKNQPPSSEAGASNPIDNAVKQGKQILQTAITNGAPAAQVLIRINDLNRLRDQYNENPDSFGNAFDYGLEMLDTVREFAELGAYVPPVSPTTGAIHAVGQGARILQKPLNTIQMATEGTLQRYDQAFQENVIQPVQGFVEQHTPEPIKDLQSRLQSIHDFANTFTP